MDVALKNALKSFNPFRFKNFLHLFIIRIMIFLKKCLLKKSQKSDVLGHNRGQIWIQHKKLLWK